MHFNYSLFLSVFHTSLLPFFVSFLLPFFLSVFLPSSLPSFLPSCVLLCSYSISIHASQHSFLFFFNQASRLLGYYAELLNDGTRRWRTTRTHISYQHKTPLSQQHCLVSRKTLNFGNADVTIAHLSSKTLLVLSPSFTSWCRFLMMAAVQQGGRGAVGVLLVFVCRNCSL